MAPKCVHMQLVRIVAYHPSLGEECNCVCRREPRHTGIMLLVPCMRDAFVRCTYLLVVIMQNINVGCIRIDVLST